MEEEEKKRRLEEKVTGKFPALCIASETRIIGSNMSNRMGWEENQYRKHEKVLQIFGQKIVNVEVT